MRSAWRFLSLLWLVIPAAALAQFRHATTHEAGEAILGLEEVSSSLRELLELRAGRIEAAPQIFLGFQFSHTSRPSQAVHAGLRFSDLSESEYRRLRDHLNSGYAQQSTRPYTSSGRLDELLPPLMQALVGHWFEASMAEWDRFHAMSTVNCWSTAYEIQRTRASTALDYTAFYIDGEDLEAVFADRALFELVAIHRLREFALSVEDIRALRPGDVVHFYTRRWVHSAVVVAPGLLFEKSDAFSSSFFRLATLRQVVASWGASELHVLRLRPGASLPHPAAFADAPWGGNGVLVGDPDQFALVSPLPPLERLRSGAFVLPAAAYDSSRYGVLALPGRPLVPTSAR
jgi:hypothetical protein